MKQVKSEIADIKRMLRPHGKSQSSTMSMNSDFVGNEQVQRKQVVKRFSNNKGNARELISASSTAVSNQKLKEQLNQKEERLVEMQESIELDKRM